MASESSENPKREGAMFTDLALTVFRKKHGRSEQNQKVQALTPHVPALVMFADHTKKMPWSCTYHSVLMFADISGFTSLCERYSAMEKSGIDELTSTLNGYMGAIVDGILSSDGDVLKYAGDAILAMWRVNIESELPATLDRVIQCCLDIQSCCGEWDTDIGVKLTVKMGIAAGDMTMTFLGNSEFRHYVELGRVVSDVNKAESFCKSGYVVLSPHAWFLCNSTLYEHEKMDDGAHVRIMDVHATEVIFKSSSSEVGKPRERRFSLNAIGLSARFMASPKRRMSMETSTPSKRDLVVNKGSSFMPKIHGSGADESARKSGFSAKTMSNVFKLRNVVKTVTAMRLEETLRLYVLSPVLKKLDDNQPLEYLSEMRQVSIVFCNLVLEDAHDHTQLLQQIFDIVFSNIKLVHGCLNKIFLFDKGCTFLVIFGLPGFKHERDCAHALNISVKMKEILDNVSGIERVSVGVTTGTTFCGVIGHTRRHEYSVIGRKVNMAARLMMHYPGKVTCDDDTFQSCRLPPENFSILVTKRMKGLRNVGIIREFSLPDEDDTEGSELENNIPYSEYPLLGREEEKEMFLRELNRLAGEETPRHHIIYVGAAGIGKTRLLDTLCNMAVKANMRLVSFSLVVHNTNTAHFLARHLLRMLLASCGYSQEIQNEPAVAETMRLCGMDQHIEVMGELLSSKVRPSGAISEARCEILTQVFEFLSKMCIDSLGPTVFIIDDMHFCDKESWDCILSLSEHAHVLLVLGFRSYALEQIQHPAAKSLFKEKRSVVKDLYTLDLSLVSALACQCLDVVNIPKQLERLLVERSQGVPSWVERLLQEMFSQRQILIRYTDLSQNSILGSVVAPRRHLITKTANIWRTKDRKRPSVAPVFADIDTLQLSGAEDTMLTDLGYAINKESKDKNKSEKRICIMAPGISITDIPVPVSMKDLVVARIDSMRATEQLIVKCAAILEPPYTRQMLEEVLPQASTFKISESLKRLFENGTFECWHLSDSTVPLGRLEDRRGECKCPRTDGVDGPEVLCNQLGFRHKLLKNTAQEMLMGKQKQRLHQKAGEFVEQRVKNIRKYVPYQLFVRNRTKQSNKMKNEDTSSDTPDKDAQASERFRTILKSGEMNPHLSLILEGAVIDDKRSSRLEQMLVQYTKIAFHYSAADDMLCLLDIQTEAALVSIVLKRLADALTWLSEAKVSLEKLERSSNQPAEVTANLRTIRAGLERLMGKALHQGGQLVEAGLRFNEAAELLDLASLTSTFSRRFLMFKMKMSTFPKFIYFTRRGSVRQLRPASRKQIERGHLLGDMCRLHKDQGHLDLLLLDAWRYASNIIGKNVHIHQVLATYIHLISACMRRNWTKRAKRLESELYATCCARSSELLYDDVKMLAISLGESALLSLNAGNITQAVDRGQVAATLVGHMGNTRLSVKIYPILAFAYLAADRWEDCVELQEKLKQLEMDLEGWGVDAWSTVISLELMLAPGVPSQTFLLCLKRATSCLMSYDAAINGSTARYFIAMSIAVWYSRKGKWTEAQAWFDLWENYGVDMNNYLTVGAWCKKLECMLMSMCRTIETEAYDPYFKAKAEIAQELRKLKKILKVVPGWKPRYHHLRAYYLLLQGKLGCTRNELQNCAQQCLKDKNAMELRLVQHTWRTWYSIITTNNSLNTDWLDQLETDLLDRRLQAQRAEQVLFAFPLPLQRPARRGRWWRSNKVRPQ